MTPEQFVRHWHAVAKIGAPRFFPDGWLRQADVLMSKGITAEDLTVVANWMRSQMARSQNREQNSVAFNAASFGWVKMFGEFGASNQHETFIARLTLAEAARKPAARAVHEPRTAACGLTVEMDARALRRLHAEIEKVLAAATSPVSTIRENCGSDPASLPGQLVTVLQMGVGYFRAAADTIKALFKARNAARRSHRKKGDK